MTGSTSKAFTAAGMSLIINNSSTIGWKTPISEIIRDDFVLPSAYSTNHVTIEDALSHRTGMPRHDSGYGSTDGTTDVTPKSIARGLRYMPLSAELRERYQYCNMMFSTIGYVIETLTKTSLGEFLTTHILEPLNMTSTYFSTEEALAASNSLARGYTTRTLPLQNDTQPQYYPVEHQSLLQVTGAGSIASNVIDYQKWIKSWIDSTGPLSHNDQQKNLIFPRTIIPITAENPFTGPQHYALGWQTGIYHGHEFIQHGGGMEAFGTALLIFPTLKYGIVVFGNTAITSNMAEAVIQWKLVDDRLFIPVDQRFNWTAAELQDVKDKASKWNNAKELLFPDAPKPGLPLSLPIEEYAGRYYHPGYGNFTVFLNGTTGQLEANRASTVFAYTNVFEHVSGDYFVVRTDNLRAPGPMAVAVLAQFQVGSSGRAERFGIDIEPELKGDMIWFDRM